MAVTTHRPVPLPQQQGHRQPGGNVPPARPGHFKIQKWYVGDNDVVRRMPYEVAVDENNKLTGHLLHQCPHEKVVNGGGRERCTTSEWLLPGEQLFCKYHGKQLVAPKDTSGERLSALLKDMCRMYGRSAAPWAIPTAGLLAEIGFTLADVSALEAALAIPALAPAGYLAVRWRLTREAIRRNRIEKGQKKGRRVRAIERRARLAGLYTAEAGVWAALLAGTDWSSNAGLLVAGAGLARWAIGAYPWWRDAERLRNRATPAETPAPVQVQAPTEPQAPPLDPVEVHAVTTWAKLIGNPGGPLPGTKLVDFKRLPACKVAASERTQLPNWTAKVVAEVPGSINMRENRPHLLGRIAAAYECSYADVSFVPDEGNVSVAYVRVQPDNVLAETKLWPGPAIANDWSRGRSRIGRFEDGEDIWYLWWNKNGAVHDLISGCSGSGKSEQVAQLILAGLHSNGLVLDWVGDPQGGQSFGSLKDHVDWFARDKTEITFLLLGAVKEMLRRNDVLSTRNIKTWQPSREMPLLVVTLDEIQSYIEDPVIYDLVYKLAGQGRKCGIKLRPITQIPAAYSLGGTNYIKEQLGQKLIFRARTETAGRSAVDPDSPIDPTQLPEKWGKNTCAAGEPTAGLMFVQGINGRDVYGRADYTGDDMDVWLVDQDGNPTTSPGVFGPDAQRVSGVLWGDRKDRAKRLLAAGRSDEDLLPGGKAVELIAAAAASATTGQPVRLSSQSQPASPKDVTARDTVLAAVMQAADERGLVDRESIVKATPELKDSTRNKALTDLVADGKLRRVRNGLYEVHATASSK